MHALIPTVRNTHTQRGRKQTAGAMCAKGEETGPNSEGLQWAQRFFPLDGNVLKLIMAMSAQL